MRAAKDQEIIDYALKTKRIIVTRDTDFGEVLRYPDRPGAIVLRFPYMFTAKELNRVDKGCSDRGIGAVQEKADLIL